MKRKNNKEKEEKYGKRRFQMKSLRPGRSKHTHTHTHKLDTPSPPACPESHSSRSSSSLEHSADDTMSSVVCGEDVTPPGTAEKGHKKTQEESKAVKQREKTQPPQMLPTNKTKYKYVACFFSFRIIHIST